jgi:hypothetical protein
MRSRKVLSLLLGTADGAQQAWLLPLSFGRKFCGLIIGVVISIVLPNYLEILNYLPAL